MKTPADMQRLEEMFHRAVGLNPEQRASFVSELRSSDPALGAEVESLLNAHLRGGSFIDSPAYQAAAQVIAEPEMHLEAGRTLGRYQILSPLGKGGMGEVYLAEDSQLRRKVAIKLLPAHLTDDKDRVRRFVQEARAASALNHPNILTIHEIGQTDGIHFIATEFVKGHTLRHLLAKKAMAVPEALGVAIQAAGALEAAHAAGIVHRDIKPENIMLRPDGYAKVLDFGLAKLTEQLDGSGPASADSQMPTRSRHFTEPGKVMGTINYMSPEQARGLDVDPRSDVFSLGVVMYEMVAGRMPFVGQTGTDVIVSILTQEPPPLTASRPEIPTGFETIVSKALRKDRTRRYQTIGELLVDLKNLNEELLFEQRFAGSERQASLAAPAATTISTEDDPTTEETLVRTTSTRRRIPVLTLALTAVIAISAIAGLLIFNRTKPDPPSAPADAKLQRSISYAVTVQKYRDGKPYQEPLRLRDDINFEKDYRLRLSVASPQNGYLYLLNEGPTATGEAPSFVVMFPSETANKGSSRLNENQQIQIPEDTFFQLDEQQGTEKIWLVRSERSVDQLEALKRFANPKDRGEITDPRLSADVSEFLKSHRTGNASVERDIDKSEAAVSASGDMLVHVINLSHH